MNKPQPASKISVSSEVIDPLYNRASVIIEEARNRAYRQVNESLIRRNWELGKIITEEELNGEDRAKYGASVIKELSKRLTATYGKGFTKRNLYNFVSFYKMYGSLYSYENGIVQSVIAQSSPILSWTHYLVLIQELNDDARRWYELEAASQNWSVRTLQRNVSSQYYYRLLASQGKVGRE
ncbi:MAG: hypothetical protein K2G11_03990 [Muribaculaceae bacterium]|nr:hypothetical protein [Muribaculaceae bacterium]